MAIRYRSVVCVVGVGERLACPDALIGWSGNDDHRDNRSTQPARARGSRRWPSRPWRSSVASSTWCLPRSRWSCWRPFLLGIAAAIRIDSDGPVLFRQRRLGRALSPFTVNKLRTMRPGSARTSTASSCWGLIAGERGAAGSERRSAARAERRCARHPRRAIPASHEPRRAACAVERHPRRYVAGRTATSDSVRGRVLPSALARGFAVKPGVTGLWQVVSDGSELTLEEMIKLDLDYVKRRSYG